MKTRYYVLGTILVLLLALFFVDREIWMKKRVMRHNMWDYSHGETYDRDKIISRGMINTEYIISFKGDIMIFDHDNQDVDTLILKWQYFSTMKVKDPKTGKTGVYSMKGANWMNYLFE